MRLGIAEDGLVHALLSHALINQFSGTCINGHCLSIVLESIGSDWAVLSTKDAPIILDSLGASLAAAGQSARLEPDLACEDVLHLGECWHVPAGIQELVDARVPDVHAHFLGRLGGEVDAGPDDDLVSSASIAFTIAMLSPASAVS